MERTEKVGTSTRKVLTMDFRTTRKTSMYIAREEEMLKIGIGKKAIKSGENVRARCDNVML